MNERRDEEIWKEACVCVYVSNGIERKKQKNNSAADILSSYTARRGGEK